MTKTKKRSPLFTPLILLAVLAVLIAGYLILKKANENAQNATAAASTNIAVANYDLSTMTALTYRVRGGEDIRLRVVDGAWQLTDDPAYPLNADRAATMAASAASLIATRHLEDVDDLSVYGLDDPACVVTVEYGSERHTYQSGDYNSFVGATYLLADGEVFLVTTDLASVFRYSLDDLLKRDTLPTSEWQNLEYVNAVVVKDGEREIEITEEDAIEAALDAVRAVSFANAVNPHASDEERAAYGLDGSRCVSVQYRKAVTTTDSSTGASSTNYLDTTYTLWIGNEGEDGFAVSPASSGIVYAVDGDTVRAILELAD